MDVNNAEIKDGDPTATQLVGEAPSIIETTNLKLDGGSGKKKRRRGKSKRKIMKPFVKAPWLDRRKNDKSKRNNRFRKIVLAKTHAPFNNNQFLMEIHKPEPENTFNKTPSRTRDSSFSVDSEDNYFFSLPEDEEEYLTKEFSSVYEDAQCERLSNMSKNELIQEYLLLEAKYDNLLKRTERSKPRFVDEDEEIDTEKDASVTDSNMTDKDTSGASNESSVVADASIESVMRHVKEQEIQLRELQRTNEQLKLENESLKRRVHDSSSEDSESDSSTSSGSSSSSNKSCPVTAPEVEIDEELPLETHNHNGQNGGLEDTESPLPMINGFLSPRE